MSRPATLTALAVVLSVACHRNTPTAPNESAGPLVFSFSPMQAAAITQIVPLGNLNPPDHTLPTNHIYFFHAAVSAVVTAPAGGQVVEVRRQADDSVSVRATPRTTYYFFHMLLDPGIVNGGTVMAGQRLGVTVARAGGLDLGVINDDLTLFFVRPERYSIPTLHADGPLKDFTDAVRAELLPKVQRNGADKDGRINFDQAGRLAGNWFLEGLSPADTENVANGPQHLSFAKDVLNPDLTRISVGGTITQAGAFWVQDGAPDPASVSAASGRVAYELFTNALRTGTGNRVLLVELVADDRIRIEVFPPGTPMPPDFTPVARIYTR